MPMLLSKKDIIRYDTTKIDIKDIKKNIFSLLTLCFSSVVIRDNYDSVTNNQDDLFSLTVIMQ